MIFLQSLWQTIPDTGSYMIAGYAVIFGIMFFYLVSITLRYRRAVQKLEYYQDQVK